MTGVDLHGAVLGGTEEASCLAKVEARLAVQVQVRAELGGRHGGAIGGKISPMEFGGAVTLRCAAVVIMTELASDRFPSPIG